MKERLLSIPPGLAEAAVEGRHNVAKAARRRLAPCSSLLPFSQLRCLMVVKHHSRTGRRQPLPARLSAFAPVPSLPRCFPLGARDNHCVTKQDLFIRSCQKPGCFFSTSCIEWSNSKKYSPIPFASEG